MGAGPAEQLLFEDSSLDAVVTTTAFHFFDQPATLREFARVPTHLLPAKRYGPPKQAA
jgi:ubiquinone/menaquinone biosynthesis C-methylase UbiE